MQSFGECISQRVQAARGCPRPLSIIRGRPVLSSRHIQGYSGHLLNHYYTQDQTVRVAKAGALEAEVRSCESRIQNFIGALPKVSAALPESAFINNKFAAKLTRQLEELVIVAMYSLLGSVLAVLTSFYST